MSLNFFYYRGRLGNFGDFVNKRFWNELSGKKITTDKRKEHFFSTGSILHWCTKNSIVCGSGFISNRSPLGHKPKKILWVRGKLTKKKFEKLNIKCPDVFGDPLLLFPAIYCNLKLKVLKNSVGVLPHFIDKGNKNVKDVVSELEKKGKVVRMLDICVFENYENLIDSILECETIVSSSLHGVVLACAYGKKVIFKQFSDKVVGKTFKFNDFFSSLDAVYDHEKSKSKEWMNNTLDYDHFKVFNISKNMLKIAPFLDDKRKKKLISNLKRHFDQKIRPHSKKRC